MEKMLEKITKSENYIEKRKELHDYLNAREEKELEMIRNNMNPATLEVIRAFEKVLDARRCCESLSLGHNDEDLERWGSVFDPVFNELNVEFRWCIEIEEIHGFVFVDDTHERLLGEIGEMIEAAKAE